MEKIKIKKSTFAILLGIAIALMPFLALASNSFSWTPNNCVDYSCTVTQNITVDDNNYWIDIFNTTDSSYATDGKVYSQDGDTDTAENESNCVSGGFCSIPATWKAVVVDSTDPNESVDCEGSGTYDTCKLSTAFIADLGTFFTVGGAPAPNLSNIFYAGMTQPIGEILGIGMDYILGIMAGILALAVLYRYVKSLIGSSGSNNRVRFTHKVIDGKDRTTGFDNF